MRFVFLKSHLNDFHRFLREGSNEMQICKYDGEILSTEYTDLYNSNTSMYVQKCITPANSVFHEAGDVSWCTEGTSL